MPVPNVHRTISTAGATDRIPVKVSGSTDPYYLTPSDIRGATVHVTDFGAVGDGLTDDTTAINAAWAAMPANSTLVFDAGKNYLISSTLLFNDNTNFCTIQGNGAKITMNSGAGLPMLNLAGGAYTKVYNLNIASPSNSSPPIVGLLLGRTAGGTGGGCAFYSCHMTGYFTYSSYYNVGAEGCKFFDCIFENYRNSAHAAYISNDDTQSLLGISAGQLTGYYYGCIFHCFGTGTCYNIYLKGYVAEHGFYGVYGVPSLGGHFIQIDAGAGATDLTLDCVFDGFRIEPNAGDNSDTRFLYQNDASLQACTFKNIGWSMNNGDANDPDYVYELVGTNSSAGKVSNCNFFLTPNLFDKKLILINDTAYLENSNFWGDNYGSTKQITVESGAELYRCSFYWPTGKYPFDATPAGMNLVQHVRDFVGDSTNKITFTDEDATPTVGGGTHFETGNTDATTIVDFDDGYDGQEIFVLVQDTDTTFDFANFGSTSNLCGNNGADLTATLYDVVRAVKHGGYWYCDVLLSKF